jgi:hypothetical protein
MTINEMRSKYNLSFYTVYNRILPGCDTKKELIKRLKKESTLAQKRIDKNNKTVKDDLELIEELEEDVVEDNIIKSETT